MSDENPRITDLLSYMKVAASHQFNEEDSRIGVSPMTDDESNTEAKKIAARLGWGCFKEVQP